MYKRNQQFGFSLPELMLAMALSLLLVLGITTVFISIKNTSAYSQQLENTQEVLRFSSTVFSRAIHRADETTITNDQLTLTFNLDNLDSGETYTSCLGNAMDSKYYETYRLLDNDLQCTDYEIASLDVNSDPLESISTNIDEITSLDVDSDPFESIGTNIDEIVFTKSGTDDNLITIDITPTGETESISIIFAQRQAILGLNE